MESQQALEGKLEALLQSLIEIGICASDVQEAGLEDFQGGGSFGVAGGLLGRKVSQTVNHLAAIQQIKDDVKDVFVPLEVINLIDAGKNPHIYTRDFIERVAGENMYTNAMLSGLQGYKNILDQEITSAFPELVVDEPEVHQANGTNGSSNPTEELNGDIKMEVES